jgi:PTS system ascorbate-specific IIA component
MAVGLFLITYQGIGSTLLQAATRVHGSAPLKVVVLELRFDGTPEATQTGASAYQALRQVDGEDGVLILTDMYGAAPSQLAKQVSELGTRCHRVSGLSLPMLLRVFNYAEQPLDELARTAAAGGRNAVVTDDA